MKTNTTKLLSLSLILSIFLFNGCSSHSEVVSVSDTHLYNRNYGLTQNIEVDKIIYQESLAMNLPTEIETSQNINPEWTSELKKDPEAFLAEEYVQTAPVITYKYKFDKEFYDKPEWRKAY